jgi:HK97 family phage portal protein
MDIRALFNLAKKSDSPAVKESAEGLKKLPRVFRQGTHPDATGRVEEKSWESPYVLYRTGQGIYAFENFSVYEIIKNYKRIAPLNSAISKLINAVSGLPLTIIDKKTKQKIEDHPLLDLLNNPNTEYQKTKKDLLAYMTLWKVLEGDLYIVATGSKNSAPKELHLLNPAFMHYEVDEKTGYINKFIYNGSAGGRIEFVKDPISGVYNSANGLQQMYHSPNITIDSGTNNLTGQSEVTSLYYEINQYLHSSRHNLSLLQNGARPSGAFVMKAKDGSNMMLSEEQFARLKVQIDEAYTGAENAGKAMVLEGGLEWQPMSMTPKDLDFATLNKDAEAQIYKNLDIPIQLVSPANTQANNMSNIRLEFYQNRILPMADDFCEVLNTFIGPRFKLKTQKLCVDRDEIDVLLPIRRDKQKLIEESTVLMINEKRKLVYNLEGVEGGDVIVDPNGRHIAGPDAVMTVGQIGASNEGDEDDKKKPKKEEEGDNGDE